MSVDLLVVPSIRIVPIISTVTKTVLMIVSINAFNIRIAKVEKYADSTNASFQNVRKMWNAVKDIIALRKLDFAFL